MVADDRLLLVGFMGAGKTSVGRRVAQETGWDFYDLDAEIERRTRQTIREIFEADGEKAFREVEKNVARELLARPRVVIASGGGWAGRAGWRNDVPAHTFSVWLDVGVEEAVRRATAESDVRPLMDQGSDHQRVSELHKVRAPYYALADERVDTEGSTVEDVTARVLESLVRRTDRTRTE